MKKYAILLFSVFVAFTMFSCSDDSGINIIDVPNGDDNGDDLGTVYSITFNVEGGGTFTFSVDMDGATIEGDDLPDDFTGSVFTFNPNNHKVFLAGSLVDWPEPGSQANLELTREGSEPGVTIAEGPEQFKFFIVPGNDPTWGYGEWDGDPNRSVDIVSGGDYFSAWGDQSMIDEPEPPAFEELFLIGDAVGGWDWDEVDLPMIPVHSKPDLFWKIVWIEADGGFKFAPQRAWENDFGYDGNDPVDEIYNFGGDNLPAPGEAGYYMVVVNVETQEISVTAPQVYLIGDTIGSWDTAAEGALFDVDNENELITITRELEAAELRMYAWFDKGWFTDWWQSEFMIFDNEIEFRAAGGDQDRVNLDEAREYTIDLNFRNGEGSIN